MNCELMYMNTVHLRRGRGCTEGRGGRWQKGRGQAGRGGALASRGQRGSPAQGKRGARDLRTALCASHLSRPVVTNLILATGWTLERPHSHQTRGGLDETIT